jgi:pseudouridine-5'-phosphate glycosidase
MKNWVWKEEVRNALVAGQPAVCMESSIFAHGLPFPHNLELAREVQRAVAQAGAVCAVVALRDGQVRFGLNDAELEELCRAGTAWAKAAVHDLGPLAALNIAAATTVSATAHLAHQAGISVVATGAIGGVHRDYGESGDMSVDLRVLGRTPVVVVCSGVKAFLDVARTVEMLEALGTPIVGYRTNRFPAFYGGWTSIEIPYAANSPEEVAAFYQCHRTFGYPSALLVVQPPPPEACLPHEELEAWIARAAEEAKFRRIRGKAWTPFVLRRLGELSGGRTVQANKVLAWANAALAAQISVALKAAATS